MRQACYTQISWYRLQMDPVARYLDGIFHIGLRKL